MATDTLAPIDLSFELNCTVSHAFQAFTTHIAKWWRTDTHSVALAQTRSCHFETKAGGRIYEIAEDGTEHDWGRVLIADAPTRLKFTWHPGRTSGQATEVEITFTAQGDKTTMRLLHRGWEIYGERAEEMRAGYHTGWQFVVGERFGGFAPTN